MRPRGTVIEELGKEIVEEAMDFCGHIWLIEPWIFLKVGLTSDYESSVYLVTISCEPEERLTPF